MWMYGPTNHLAQLSSARPLLLLLLLLLMMMMEKRLSDVQLSHDRTWYQLRHGNDCLADTRQDIDRSAHVTHRQNNTQTDRQTDGKNSTQTDRQNSTHTDRQTDKNRNANYLLGKTIVFAGDLQQ